LDQILERVEGHLETIDKKLDEDNIQKLIDDHEQRMKTNIDMIESRVKKLENGLQEKLKGVVAALVIVAGIIIFAMLRA
jgi:polyhydroxyalkanoate synthesis regulator phasin